jgi:hypothetical protein
LIHQNVLRYRRGLYLWWAVALCVLSVLLYATRTGLERKNGGTWQGYVLGTVGALLIVWLSCLGIRKRRYASSMGSVQGWASAHIYLGTALIVVATLHCAFNFGWNIHTLAYALMLGVIGSGFIGLYFYMNSPSIIADNRVGGSRAGLFAELFELDTQARNLAGRCDPAAALAVKSSIERTAIGGGVFRQLFGADSSWIMVAGASGGSDGAQIVANEDQQAAIGFISNRLPRAEKRAEAAVLQSLVTLLCRRQMILRRIRRDVRLNGWLRLWLYVHVPLSIALLAALVAHILVTFIYW